MHPTLRTPVRLLPLAVLAAFAPTVHAQHFFAVVDANGKPQVVVAAVATEVRADVEIADKNGDLHVLDSTSFRMAPAPMFGAGFIDLSNFKSEILAVTPGDAGSGGPAVHAHGTAKADRALTHCFVVILSKSKTDNEISVQPIPDTVPQGAMIAGQTVPFDKQWILPQQFDEATGSCEVHFFSNGLEIMTSLMKPEEIAAGKDKTEAYALRNHPDSPIALLRGVKPIYPKELVSKNSAGSAMLQCHVDRDGNVASVEVVSATDPAFGKAAADAVRQWTFTPAVKNHHYVEMTAEFPINFKAPAPRPTDGAGMFQ